MSTRRSDVLAALIEADGAAVSGEALAVRLGISRAAVAKHVAALGTLGYQVEAVTGVGYSLVAAPDLPVPGAVSALLRDPMWVRLEGGVETGSTNDDARTLAREGAPHGTVVLAARQSAGRGRLGRAWESPEGGLYLSAILRPQVAVADLAPMALVISLGVARGLSQLGVEPSLKWPNDLLLGPGKLAGVLIEMSAEADRAEWMVAGVGINVRPSATRIEGAVYLADVASSRADLRLANVAAVVLDGIAPAFAEWNARGFDALREEYERRSTLAGADVVVRDVTGAVRAAGIVQGIDGLGRLVLHAEDGAIAVVSAGDVTLRASAE